MYKEKWLYVDSNGKTCFTQIIHAKDKIQMDSFYERQLKAITKEPNIKFPERNNTKIIRE